MRNVKYYSSYDPTQNLEKCPFLSRPKFPQLLILVKNKIYGHEAYYLKVIFMLIGNWNRNLAYILAYNLACNLNTTLTCKIDKYKFDN